MSIRLLFGRVALGLLIAAIFTTPRLGYGAHVPLELGEIVTAERSVDHIRLQAGITTTALRMQFAFPSNDGAEFREVEDAELGGGLTRYPDYLNLSRGWAVGNVGLQEGQSVTFRQVGRSEFVSVYYNNPNSKPVQIGLLVDGARQATLSFPSSYGQIVAIQPLTQAVTTSGTVALRVEAQDVAANEGRVMVLDKVAFGRVDVAGETSVRVALRPGLNSAAHAQSAMFLTLRANGPIDQVFRITLGMQDGQEIISRPIRLYKANVDEQIVLPAEYFSPPLEVHKAITGIRSLRVWIHDDGAARQGELLLDQIAFDAAWPSLPPHDNPFEPSTDITGIAFTGRRQTYTQADTWYPTWAANDVMYSPYTDGTVDGIFSRSDNFDATTGMATIEGNDPMNLKVTSLGLYRSSPWPFATRYPCGSLVHDGVWYFGTYIINGNHLPDGLRTYQGPFVGFRTSQDYGKSWVETPRTPQDNLFGERVDVVPGGWSKIKMGSPHFVDFGRNMEHSPDGKAYLIAHGCTKPDSVNTWIRGDEAYLCRVKPSIETINERDAYEFYAGTDSRGKSRWTEDFGKIAPLFTWDSRVGCITMTYNAGLKRYLVLVSHGDGVDSKFHTYMLEGRTPTGPFRMVSYMENFGTQAYFVNVPSKFISPDGRTMWLCYSANWTGHEINPPGSQYSMCLQEVRLLGPEDAAVEGRTVQADRGNQE